VFDLSTTVFDEDATDFFDETVQSGAVYTYDLLASANGSILNPDKFVFGQQIANPAVISLDQYGTAVNYTSGVVLSSAPGNDVEDSTLTGKYGTVFVSVNETNTAAWTVLREQKPVVDVRLLNSVYSYDRLTSAVAQYFDLFLSITRQDYWRGQTKPGLYWSRRSCQLQCGTSGHTWHNLGTRPCW
jgi:hypothetical protein